MISIILLALVIIVNLINVYWQFFRPTTLDRIKKNLDKKNKWTKVSRKLPEPYVRVLVYTSKGEFIKSYIDNVGEWAYPDEASLWRYIKVNDYGE